MGERKYLVSQEELARAIEEAETIGIPFSQKGAANGVATLDGEEHLTLAQVPPPVVTSSAVGFAPSVIYLDSTPEFYGAKTTLLEPGFDSTAAFQALSEALVARGGGTARVTGREYIVDGLVWENGVNWKSQQGAKTILKARAGSTNPGQILLAKGFVTGEWDGFWLEENGNEGQHGFYFKAQEPTGGGSGGLLNCSFSNILVTGRPGAAYGMWFQGGAIGSALVHQFCTFSQVTIYREGSGSAVRTNRCFKATGQVEKLEFDAGCTFASTVNKGPGTNIELSREFLLSTTLTASVAASATAIKVASATGLEAGKVFKLDDSVHDEICEVKEIIGLEVVLKSALAYAHESSCPLYALSGTVGAPTTRAPSGFAFFGSTIQSSAMEILVDTGVTKMDCYGVDFEQSNYILKVRKKAYEINLHGATITTATEGTGNGRGTITVGSATITGAGGSWAEGEKISAPGIKPGTTVTHVAGTTLTISSPVEANGAEGAAEVALAKGGNGEGYVALYEGESQGVCTYYASGATDQGIIGVGSAARMQNLVGNSMVRVSSGLTLVVGTAESLEIQNAHEVVLSNATTTIKSFSASHATGETVIVHATKAATKFASGGNITLPGGTLTLGVNDIATFLRSDYSGFLTWILVDVQRATEVGLEPKWEEIGELHANLVAASGYPPHIQTALLYTGMIGIRGAAEATAELASSPLLFNLPVAFRPETKRGPIPIGNSEGKYTTIVIAPNGNVNSNETIKSGVTICLDGINFAQKP
jgi:hypothetical protein